MLKKYAENIIFLIKNVKDKFSDVPRYTPFIFYSFTLTFYAKETL